MSEQAATIEHIFSDEYWQPQTVGIQASKPHSFSYGTNRFVDYLCSEAATGLYSGRPEYRDESLASVPDGVHLGSWESRRIAKPWTVLLADVEFLAAGKHHPKQQSADTPSYRSKHMDSAAEVTAPASDLFRQNSHDQVLPSDRREIRIYPYDKALLSPDEALTYRRYIALLVFARSKHGDTVGFFQRHWSVLEVGKVQGYMPAFTSKLREAYSPMEVGQSYFLPRQEAYKRLKSAAILPPPEIDQPPVRGERWQLPDFNLPSAVRRALGARSVLGRQPALGV